MAEQSPPLDTPPELSNKLQVSPENLATLLEWRWADFHLYIIDPTFSPKNPPVVIPPEKLQGSDIEAEFVYPIYDFGYKLSTSKGDDANNSGMSMCKLYYTIEKMIAIFIERLKEGGTDTETEVQVAFHGFLLALRKAFESVINLPYNVVVINFNPGEWGDRYLELIKVFSDKNLGYPEVAPRYIYRHLPKIDSKPKKS